LLASVYGTPGNETSCILQRMSLTLYHDNLERARASAGLDSPFGAYLTEHPLLGRTKNAP
jgi:hypothetical protein